MSVKILKSTQTMTTLFFFPISLFYLLFKTSLIYTSYYMVSSIRIKLRKNELKNFTYFENSFRQNEVAAFQRISNRYSLRYREAHNSFGFLC